MKQEKSCGAVIYREGEKGMEILLIQHKSGGHWASPKGHVEAGETEADTAKREIWEETGLEVELDTKFRRVIAYSPKRGVMKDVVFFCAKAVGGELKAQPEEVLNILWLDPKEAVKTATFDTDKDVIKAFLAYKR